MSRPPGPAALALGVVAAAAATTLAPGGAADGAPGVLAAVLPAAAIALAIAAAACGLGATSRRIWGEWLAVAALGAALLMGRVAFGAATTPAGAPAGVPSASPATAPAAAPSIDASGTAEVGPLPQGAGTWAAIVEATRGSGGQQTATLVVAVRAGSDLRCSAGLPAYPRLLVGTGSAGRGASGNSPPATTTAGLPRRASRLAARRRPCPWSPTTTRPQAAWSSFARPPARPCSGCCPSPKAGSPPPS
jgi:hypothetical protein